MISNTGTTILEDILILHCTLTIGGGVGTVIKELISEQLKQGFSIGLLFPETEFQRKEFFRSFPIENIELFPIRLTKRSIPILNGLPLRKVRNLIIKENHYKEVLLHIHNPATIGLFRVLSGAPSICTLHGIDHANINHPLYKIIYYQLLKKPTELVAVSNHTSQFYSQYYKKDIHVIHNGIKDGTLLHNRDSKLPFLVGFVGYLDDLKGWKYLYTASKKISFKLKDRIEFVFVGEGPDSTELSSSINIESIDKFETVNIKYIGIVEDAGNSIIPRFDVVVLPSLSEGLPMVLLEAIRSGIPILATGVGGIPEILVDGETGLLVERDPETIANAIEKLFTNVSLYTQMSANCRRKFQAEFSIHQTCKQYQILYESIID